MISSSPRGDGFSDRTRSHTGSRRLERGRRVIDADALEARRDGRPVVGYGFASFGRFAQGGLIRERFAPRLTEGDPERRRMVRA